MLAPASDQTLIRVNLWMGPAAALLLLAGLAGCAEAPTHQNYRAQDAACVEGEFANLIRYHFEGEAHVTIGEIDGLPTGGGEPYCFPPGLHRLEVKAYNNSRIARDSVDLEFGAAKKYRLRANVRGTSFVFQLVDITRSPGATVEEFSMAARAVTAPWIAPIGGPSQ